ncbi:MAG: flagellar hook-length control protein FliK, partial [Caulobacteraceae bacterium]
APITPVVLPSRVQSIAAVEAAHVAELFDTPEAPPPPGGPARPQPDPAQQAVAAARAEAAGRQAGLAPLFADLGQALASPKTPPQLRAAIAQALSLQLPTAAPLTGETVRQAVASSGLFLEAHLAAQTPAAGPPPPDLKAALLTLRRLLAEAQPGAPLHTRAASNPPPTRDAALGGQPPATATLPPGADLAAIAQRLGGDTEQAIARQVLHQLASLPEAGGSAWMFELPVATPQGAAVAQFEIDQDAHTAVDGEVTRTWRVRFSIDIEPLGPVHVQLGAGGERAAVIIWAEREDSLERLRGRGGELAGALPADVVFHPGAPRRASPPAGGLLDRTL